MRRSTPASASQSYLTAYSNSRPGDGTLPVKSPSHGRRFVASTDPPPFRRTGARQLCIAGEASPACRETFERPHHELPLFVGKPAYHANGFLFEVGLQHCGFPTLVAELYPISGDPE